MPKKTDYERHLEQVLMAEREAHQATLFVVRRLRLGLQQIVTGDYPADAIDAETWAKEVLDRPEAVEWERDDDNPSMTEVTG